MHSKVYLNMNADFSLMHVPRLAVFLQYCKPAQSPANLACSNLLNTWHINYHTPTILLLGILVILVGIFRFPVSLSYSIPQQ